MLTLELICKKEFVQRENRILRYSDFTSGDEFSILFRKDKRLLYVYDSINIKPEEFDLDMYDYVIFNHYIHYTIEEMVSIYKEYIDSQRVVNSYKKFTFSYNEKMSLEKLKDSLTDNWRKEVVENLFGKLSELEIKMQNEDALIDVINSEMSEASNDVIKQEVIEEKTQEVVK